MPDLYEPQAAESVIVRIYERYGCWYIEGRVLKRGHWLDAKFTVPKEQADGKTRDEFRAWCLRQLPHVTEDQTYEVAV